MIAYPQIDPVAFSLGPVQLHWYGLMYVVGLTAAWWLGRRRAHRLGLTHDDIGDLIFYGALGVIIGGRLGYVLFYGLDQLIANPLWLFKIWEGGMSFHGGLAGVLVAAWLFARRHRLAYLQLTDFIAPLVPIGLGAGRLGNFINHELPGRASDVPWAMIFPPMLAWGLNPDIHQHSTSLSWRVWCCLSCCGGCHGNRKLKGLSRVYSCFCMAPSVSSWSLCAYPILNWASSPLIGSLWDSC